MANAKIAPHEAIELKEFVHEEIVGIKKMNTSIQSVKDEDLKNFIQDLLNSKKAVLKEINMQVGGQ